MTAHNYINAAFLDFPHGARRNIFARAVRKNRKIDVNSIRGNRFPREAECSQRH